VLYLPLVRILLSSSYTHLVFKNTPISLTLYRFQTLITHTISFYFISVLGLALSYLSFLVYVALLGSHSCLSKTLND